MTADIEMDDKPAPTIVYFPHPRYSPPSPAILDFSIRGTPAATTTTRVITYTYDPLDRLTEADYSTGEQFEYAYDAVGNRTAMTSTIDHVSRFTPYEYDAANRLTSVDGVTYTWDTRGNLVSDGTFTYTYNAAGRMVRAEGVTSTLVYTYNAAGLRVAQSAESSQSVFSWDWASGIPEMLVQSPNPPSPNHQSLYLVGHDTLGQWDGGEWQYYLPDALGSVRQVADGAGTVVSAREWTPYGVEVGAAQSGPGYTGEWWDADVGLEYLRARWYDGSVGRFTRRDPWSGNIKQPQTRNGWTYADGNPINLVDPIGLYSISEIKGFFGASLYDPGVLHYFEEGQPLAGRWGWLEVLRQAENGDRLLAFKHLGGCPPSPNTVWVYGPGMWENIGEFWKTDIGDLFLVQGGRGLSHHQAALEGTRYRVEELDHCIYNPYTGVEIDCGSYIENWGPKMKYGPWEIDPMHKYMGWRCDPADADWVEVAVNGVFLLLPYVTGEDAEDILDLVKLMTLVANASTKEDASAAIDTFIEEANMTILKLTAKYGAKSTPVVGQIVSAIDSFSDVKSIMDNSGCHWLP